MEDVRNLVSRTPPEGLASWGPVRKALNVNVLLYEAVWVEDMDPFGLLDERAKPKRRKQVEVRCTCCGDRRLLDWTRTDPVRGGYGFLHPGEDFAPAGSGDGTTCPMCGAAVLVKKAAEIRKDGYYLAAETTAISAGLTGRGKYLTLTVWSVQLRVFRSGWTRTEIIPGEAYVFSQSECACLMGWKKAYSGTAGYFISYTGRWSQSGNWPKSGIRADAIFGLMPELIAESCLPHCKLDVYMDAFRGMGGRRYPAAYLRLVQTYPQAGNLLVSGLPLVLDELLAEACGNRKLGKDGLPWLPEICWAEVRPAQMLGLDKEELRMAQAQGWGAFFWRLYLRAKAHGERLTVEDIRRAHQLGDETIAEIPGHGPVGKSLRYLLRQIEISGETDPEECVDEDVIDAAMLLDYWRVSAELGRNLDDDQVRWPRDLIAAHDAAMGEARARKKAEEARELASKFRVRRRLLAKYAFRANGLSIVPAASQEDLRRESDALHHCVWSYARRHANGKTAIFFIRRTAEPGRPYYTLELDEKTLQVRQNRGLRNCGRTPEIQAFEELWIAWVRSGAPRDRRGKPVLPKITPESRSA